MVVLLETTAGCGTALGSTFEELAVLRALIGDEVRHRVAFCADTCHLYSAGYDLVGDYDGVWRQWDEILGLDHLRCLHLNDSKTPFASRRDRHELIGEGSLGPGPFRRIMTDPRLAHVIKILETPKGDDGVTADRKMLRRLRRYARATRYRALTGICLPRSYFRGMRAVLALFCVLTGTGPTGRAGSGGLQRPNRAFRHHQLLQDDGSSSRSRCGRAWPHPGAGGLPADRAALPGRSRSSP